MPWLCPTTRLAFFVATEVADVAAAARRSSAAPWIVARNRAPSPGGAVLRSRPQAGLELTEAELRVALLTAEGLTDREICGQLYLGPKTVEFHLGLVHRTLGVRGRTELARRLPGC